MKISRLRLTFNVTVSLHIRAGAETYSKGFCPQNCCFQTSIPFLSDAQVCLVGFLFLSFCHFKVGPVRVWILTASPH